MSRVAYVNGRFVPHGEAAVHIEDRGYQFADGVYEVWAVMGGALGDAAGHFERLARSLGELQIAAPMSAAPLEVVLPRPCAATGCARGWSTCRSPAASPGATMPFPNPPVPPSVVVTAHVGRSRRRRGPRRAGVAVITMPETRWARCDIKTVALLPNVLAKQRRARPARSKPGSSTTSGSSPRARQATPGSSTSPARSAPATPRPTSCAASPDARLFEIMAREGLKVEERPFIAGGGQGGARSLHHRRRHAAAAHCQHRRQAGGRWRARPGGETAAATLYRGGAADRGLSRAAAIAPASN